MPTQIWILAACSYYLPSLFLLLVADYRLWPLKAIQYCGVFSWESKTNRSIFFPALGVTVRNYGTLQEEKVYKDTIGPLLKIIMSRDAESTLTLKSICSDIPLTPELGTRRD